MKSDIIQLLESKAAAPSLGGDLPLISLWNPGTRVLMFFTLHPDHFGSHYAEEERFKFHCLGDNCPACAVGLRATEHLYIPVWDLANRRIAVLSFHTGPDGPAAPILQFLKTYRDQLAEVVAFIEGEGRGKIRITAREVLPETDRGAVECAEFCAGLESGAITLRNCARQLSADEIEALSEVKRKVAPRVGGLVLPKPPATASSALNPQLAEDQ